MALCVDDEEAAAETFGRVADEDEDPEGALRRMAAAAAALEAVLGPLHL